jgi:HlyD family secretion protein
MTRHVILPAVAGAILLFGVGHALYVQWPEKELPPPVPPPTTPFGQTVAGDGMVEPANEASGTSAVAVGSQVAGLVTGVPVRIGQEMKAGDLLVQLDRRQAEAQLKINEAQAAVARAAERQAEDTYKRDLNMSNEAVSDAQRVIDQEAWHLAVAQRQVAEAAIRQAETTLALLEVRAPSDGAVLQVNVRPGEYVSTLGGQSLILMGNLHPLHVRVNVDEEDVPRLVLNAPARAHIRGDPEQNELPLTFVRLEPYIVPKVSMTGINVERVDTRVVQVIYALDPANRLVQEKKVLVGQLLDVFIDTRATAPPESTTGSVP